MRKEGVSPRNVLTVNLLYCVEFPLSIKSFRGGNF
nr:MAG TPA: hypothetical protein [Caudoviricetes sp.]